MFRICISKSLGRSGLMSSLRAPAVPMVKELILGQQLKYFTTTRCLEFHQTYIRLARKNIVVPPLAESLSEGDVKFEKSVGDTVIKDDLLANIETDKTVIPVESPVAGKVVEEQEEENRIYDREFVEMKKEDFAEIYNEEPELEERIVSILGEYEYAKYNSMGRVPSVLGIPEMRRLLKEGLTQTKRDSIIHFLFKREMDKRASQRKREEEKKAIKLRRAAKFQQFQSMPGNRRSGLLDDNDQIMYGLWHNSLFCRIPENKMKAGSSHSRLMSAAMFGRKLIFDFDFGDYMTDWTYRNAIDQVQEAYGINRFQNYEDPFDIWFCNLKKGSMAEKYCSDHAFKNLYSGSMITIKDDCFTNHFDKSRLVYLSPNAREPLGKVNKSDDIYIIGVYNDKGNHQPVSHRKALKLGIRTKCLPLDSHVVWQGPTKALCVNHVTGILLEVLDNGGDWQAALMKHVPKRKIKPMEVVMEEEAQRMQRLRNRKKRQIFNLREDLDL